MRFQLRKLYAKPALGLALILLTGACSARGAETTGPRPAMAMPVEDVAPVIDPAASFEPTDVPAEVLYDLPIELNHWVEGELNFLVHKRPQVISSWIERGVYYKPFIESVLREFELPADLYHLAMIESGFNPSARSHAGAVGMWQFMPATARAEGLRVDGSVDERLDPIRSTRAAARHLRTLHGLFGDWALAAAAYNAGVGRVSRGMKAVSARNFWELSRDGDLAAETRQYVPRLYAVTVIGKQPERFGLNAPPSTSGFAFDSVFVDFETPLADLAAVSDVSVAALRELNPHLLRGETPGGGYWVWVPDGEGQEVQRAYLTSAFRRERGLASYKVRSGDTLGRIALDAELTIDRLMELNPSLDPDLLKIGQSIRMPGSALERLTSTAAARETHLASAAGTSGSESSESSATQTTSTETRVVDAGSTTSPGHAPASEQKVATAASAPAGTSAQSTVRRSSHEVREGESLWSLARRYGVDVEKLRSTNDLNGDVIVPGQQLVVPVDAAEHVVENGDTLWSLARRYSTTVSAIQQANGLTDGSILPGQTLVIPL